MAHSFIKKIVKMLANSQQQSLFSPAGESSKEKQKLSTDLTVNISTFREILGNSMDLEIRVLYMGNIQVALIYIDGIIDQAALRENAIRALMVDFFTADPNVPRGKGLTHALKERIISVCCVKESKEINKLVHGVLGAYAVLIIDGDDTGLTLKLPSYATRNLEEPQNEQVVRGPREGFVESIGTNLSMLRRKIRSPQLRLENAQVGRITKTQICVAYLKDIADPAIVEEVKKRLGRIEIDGVLESGYLEEFIEDAPRSIFPTVGNSEKPDKVAAQLLEGRVAIFTDGTPIVLTVPYLWAESLQSSEDYYARPYYGAFVRCLRLSFVFITIALPGIYVALSSFNSEPLPTLLLLTLMESKEGVFLPVFGEVLLMGIIFEGLREAGARYPRNIGQALSIVGALVIGQAAVAAGFISAPTVIVTALTAISSFVVPSQLDALLMQRIFYTLLAGFFGFYGLFLGMGFVLVHLVSLRSLGVPYLSPLAPTSKTDLKDTLIRAPWWYLKTRPESLHTQDKNRAGDGLEPAPPEKHK